MSKYSIHLEADAFVVREGYVARTVADAGEDEPGFGDAGMVVGSFSTRFGAVSKVSDLRGKELHEYRDAAAKEISGA